MRCQKLYRHILLFALLYTGNASAQDQIISLPLDRLNQDSLNKVIQKAESKKDYKTLCDIYGGLFMYYCESKYRALATDYAIKTEGCALKIGDSAKYFFTENKLGEFSADAHDFKTAIKYYQKALQYYQRTKNYKMLFHVYGGLANACSLNQDSVNSRRYELLAVQSNEKGKDTLGIAITNDLRTRNLIDSNRFTEAISLAQKTLALIKHAKVFGSGEITRTIRERLELNFLGECYFGVKNYNKAIEYLNQALPYVNETDFNDLDISRYQLLIKCYVSLNEKDSAKKYTDLLTKSTFQTLENVNPEKLNEISAKYESEKKQMEIERLQQQNHIQQLTVSTQRKLNIAFISIALLACITAFLIIKNSRQKRKIQFEIEKQKAGMEKREAIQTERYRISSELHDDLGGGLSTIRLLSEMMKEKGNAGNFQLQLSKISDSSKELVQKMNEIVWALNINNDNLQSLLAYIRQYVVKTLDDVGINCNVRMPDGLPEISIAGNERRNIFLMVKECVHNIIKHSKTSQVNIEIGLNENICIQIHDNGIGFSNNKNDVHHFGLTNLKQRAGALNGNIQWQQNNGTLVIIEIPLKSISNKSVISRNNN
jgi:signal transduction histidine kinase